MIGISIMKESILEVKFEDDPWVMTLLNEGVR